MTTYFVMMHLWCSGLTTTMKLLRSHQCTTIKNGICNHEALWLWSWRTNSCISVNFYIRSECDVYNPLNGPFKFQFLQLNSVGTDISHSLIYWTQSHKLYFTLGIWWLWDWPGIFASSVTKTWHKWKYKSNKNDPDIDVSELFLKR